MFSKVTKWWREICPTTIIHGRCSPIYNHFAQLTCAEGDISVRLTLAVVAYACEADVIRPATLQLGQITAVFIGLTRRLVAVLSCGSHHIGAGSLGCGPRHLGCAVFTVHISFHIISRAGSWRQKGRTDTRYVFINHAPAPIQCIQLRV